jgi:hypothetical protein
MSDGPNIVESVRSRGNRFGFRRFFEGEVIRAFNLTMKQATSLFGDIAKESIRMEMHQMLEKGVWKPILWNAVDTIVIPSKMFLKEKKDCKGLREMEMRVGEELSWSSSRFWRWPPATNLALILVTTRCSLSFP